MAYDTGTKRVDMPHNVIIEGRSRMIVSGVEDVESFDETTIVMYTSRGLLTVRGGDLHIDKLSIDGGELSVEGMIDAIQYEDEQPQKGGFFSRLFG